jgi:hypothetical protein
MTAGLRPAIKLHKLKFQQTLHGNAIAILIKLMVHKLIKGVRVPSKELPQRQDKLRF